jgi:DNA-binding MarR family transcriptional regulator
MQIAAMRQVPPQADIAIGLAKIGTYLRTQQWRQADGTALTPTQQQILAYLTARGPSRVTMIALEIGVTQPTASDAAAALVRKGHLERRADPTDARATALHLTAKGQQAARAAAVWPDALLGAIGTLAPDEQSAFARGLTKMIRSLQERGEIPVQRMCATCRFFRPNAHDDAERPHHCAFVDAAFGDAALRLDCGDHEPADPSEQGAVWRRFASADG